MNLFCKIFPQLCKDQKEVIDDCAFSNSYDTDEFDKRRALSELKSSRTLIKKATMRLNSNKLGRALYDLDNFITNLEIKLKK